MYKRFILNNRGEELVLIRQRIILSGLIILLLLSALALRIFYLQVVEHEHYKTLSQHNRVKILPIPPIRGLIYSRDGVLLADNHPSFSLEIVPEHVDDMDVLLLELAQLVSISHDDLNRFRKTLKRKRLFESIPLRFNLSEQEVAVLSVNLHKLTGADIVARLNRYYPHAGDVVHTIGYVGRIDEEEMQSVDKSNYSGTTHIGKLGVEKSYEDILHGKVGYQQVEVNAQGRIIRVLDRQPPEAGKNLYLSLDLGLQKVASQALEGRKGAIVAMDPNNGEILAFVSTPVYDPNLFVNGIDSRSYKFLLNAVDRPLINRTINGKYPPGSTIKPFLGLMALEAGIKNQHEEVWCPGWFSLKGNKHRYRDWKKQGHGHVDLSYAIMQSCDVYFYSLAYEMGIDKINESLGQFGFGKPTGIDIGGESSALLPSREWKKKALKQPWYPGETLIVGIGQGYMLVTPLQLAAATSVLANGGKFISPHLVSKTMDPISQEESFPYKPDVISLPKKNIENWQHVVQSMVDVVHAPRGTARRSGLDAEYQFAGKTGTAQVIGIAQDEEYEKDELDERFHDHAWFIAFAPAESPKIAVAILVENGGGGSRSAAPIARKLFDQYLLKKTSG